jgi:hypothetical protein
MNDELFSDIKFFLFKESYNVGVLDSFFDQSAIEARKRKGMTPTEAEMVHQRELAIQHLNDFSSVWGPISLEYGGVRDQDLPSSELPAYREAAKEHKAWSGANATYDVDKLGNLTIRQAHKVIRISAEDRDIFLRILMSLPGKVPSLTSFAMGYSSSSQVPETKGVPVAGGYDDRPSVVAGQRQNEERMAHAVKMARAEYDRAAQLQAQARRERMRQEMHDARGY